MTDTLATNQAAPDTPRPVPARRRAALLWRIAMYALALLLGLVGVWIAAGSYTPPDPAECAALRGLVSQSPDVVYEMERRGCPNVPYEAVNWP